jgi:hypothetical protein
MTPPGDRPLHEHERPPWTRPIRVTLSLVAAILGGALVWFYYTRYAPTLWSDFDQVWLGSRALLSRRDPYIEVPQAFPWPLYYPLTTLLLGLPFAALPLLTGRILFAALTAGLAVWAILRHRPHAWPLLLSAPFAYSLIRGQWAPLLVAGVLIPMLGGVVAAKPSTGLATFVYRPARTAMAGAALLGVISLALQPSWPATWLRTLQYAPHLFVPALMPGGFILLVALGRWRRPDARLLAVLSCIPQTPGIYELFVMALVPSSRRQAAAVGLTWNVFYLVTLATHDAAPLTMAHLQHDGVSRLFWPYMLLLGYLPVLACVLWPSPLRELPNGYIRWPVWRQQTYRVIWTTVLVLVGSSALLWAYFLWARG